MCQLDTDISWRIKSIMSKFTTFPDDLCQRACQPRHDRLQVLGDILTERESRSFAKSIQIVQMFAVWLWVCSRIQHSQWCQFACETTAPFSALSNDDTLHGSSLESSTVSAGRELVPAQDPKGQQPKHVNLRDCVYGDSMMHVFMYQHVSTSWVTMSMKVAQAVERRPELPNLLPQTLDFRWISVLDVWMLINLICQWTLGSAHLGHPVDPIKVRLWKAQNSLKPKYANMTPLMTQDS